MEKNEEMQEKENFLKQLSLSDWVKNNEHCLELIEQLQVRLYQKVEFIRQFMPIIEKYLSYNEVVHLGIWEDQIQYSSENWLKYVHMIKDLMHMIKEDYLPKTMEESIYNVKFAKNTLQGIIDGHIECTSLEDIEKRKSFSKRLSRYRNNENSLEIIENLICDLYLKTEYVGKHMRVIREKLTHGEAIKIFIMEDRIICKSELWLKHYQYIKNLKLANSIENESPKTFEEVIKKCEITIDLMESIIERRSIAPTEEFEEALQTMKYIDLNSRKL